jgi:hypothetical protein
MKAARCVMLVVVAAILGIAWGGPTLVGQAGRAWNAAVADQIGPGGNAPVADQIGPGGN